MGMGINFLFDDEGVLAIDSGDVIQHCDCT